MHFIDALVPTLVLSVAYYLLFTVRQPQETEAQHKKGRGPRSIS
jgi:hypothetical protein